MKLIAKELKIAMLLAIKLGYIRDKMHLWIGSIEKPRYPHKFKFFGSYP
jgi:hypothetical protein